MTNYEKIKNMSIDEMAKLIHKIDDLSACNHCLGLCIKDDVKPDKNGCIHIEVCERGIKKWLESECDE